MTKIIALAVLASLITFNASKAEEGEGYCKINKAGSRLCTGEDGPTVTFRNGQSHFFHVENCNAFSESNGGITTICHNGKSYNNGRRMLKMTIIRSQVADFAVGSAE